MALFGGNDDGKLERKLDVILAELDIVLEREDTILQLLRARNLPSSMTINQLNSRSTPMSTPAGGSSVFQEVPTPVGSIFPTGTTFSWTVDDTADISLTPTPDGTQCTATCVATPTGTNYNLTCTSSYTPPGAPTPISVTLNVPITPAVILPTGATIVQLS